jgi:endonuclease-3
MRRLAVAITGLELPAVEKISQSREEDPFQVTIATLLSARTQDATTYAASERLFRKAATPDAMSKLTVKQIEKLIYPVSFYRYKARYIKATCAKLLREFDGKTPSTMEGLLSLPGVGRKTANLVLIVAYESRKNICVDTHVHRIANRLGWVTPGRPKRRSRRSIARRKRNGGRSSTCTLLPGARTCAGRFIHAARRAPSRISARASA